MSEYKLTTELLKLSQSQKWNEAKLEWELADVEEVEEPETCLCGHFPILEVCMIENARTQQNARVGNSCVKKFNNKSDKIFRSVASVKKKPEKSVNSETLEFARQKGWVTTKDYEFYIDILRRRSLSEKQLAWKKSVNNKILCRIKRN
ncbi:MAG: hypothetical protein A2675_03230 [Candidatus Yonathbacteria bacterium RIFCSPHIGHO2_01_FULL_51_10]|uniref:Uncharacterized protein n=1 Tax=Candidatus Yonathbacteria bacterium RIFCSPHIGHO2_01_FULL_51_10 TaxID=1802723 RepID=A0A1G2S4K9_9BACT|nr:MAG: hypothetical protein A2675_03230 [Candidatus Yonathbacteria bacterium RIFCSPHIGHO2_01_FULL_51_10]